MQRSTLGGTHGLVNGSKGVAPACPQVVEQQTTELAVWGGQPGKGFEPVAVTSPVHDRMPVILDPESYDLGSIPECRTSLRFPNC